MEDELKQRLNESAADLIEWVERTGTEGEQFMREQAPLVAQEVITFQLWVNGIYLAIAFLIFGGLCCLAWRLWRFKPDNELPAFAGEVRLAARVGSLVAIAVGVLIVVATLTEAGYHFAAAYFAPRVVILHELQKLL